MTEFAPEPPVQKDDGRRSAETIEQRLSAFQLRLSIDTLRDTALTMPAWAALMCAVFGGLAPTLGTTSIYLSWPWPVFCLGMASAVVMLAQYVR